MNRLDGKVAVVTGAGAGIGRAISLLFAKEGASVAVTDINETDAQNVAKEITSMGGSAQSWRLDVSRESQVERVMQSVKNEFGLVTVLVNNAGITGVDKRTHEIAELEWDAVFAVDVKGVFFCTKHVIPQMFDAGGGSIVNFSSIYGIVGSHELTPYHAAKGTVAIMTKQDAISYAKDGIRVNSVHPGTIITATVKELAERSPGGLAEYQEMISAKHPIGHVGEAIDIAFAVLYLASDEAKFTTGAALSVDGGYTAW